MRARTTITRAVIFGIASVGLLMAKSKWDQAPFEQWSRDTVTKLFNDSPWAQAWTKKNENAAGGGGVNEQEFDFSVRMFSALPMRQAYVRLLQFMNNYGAMAPEQKKNFDGHVNPLLNANVSDEVVLAVAYHTTDQRALPDLKRFFDNATTATLNQQAYLYSPEVGRVDLKEYLPPGTGGIGARFIYPRVVNGKPLLQPGDKALRFEFWVNWPVNDKLMVDFDGRKMVYNGQLSY